MARCVYLAMMLSLSFRFEAYPQHVKSFDFQIRAPKGDILASLEELVPKGENAEGAWTEIGRNFVGVLAIKTKWERGPLSLRANGHRIVCSTTVAYRAQVAQRVKTTPFPGIGGHTWAKLASCGHDEPMRLMDIGIEFEIVLANGSDFTCGIKAIPVAPRNRCLLTAANIDCTAKIQALVQRAIDNQAGKLNSRVQDYVKKYADQTAAISKNMEGTLAFYEDRGDIVLTIGAAGSPQPQPPRHPPQRVACVHRTACTHLVPCAHRFHPFDTLHPFDVAPNWFRYACRHNVPCVHPVHRADWMHPFDQMHPFDEVRN